MLELARYVRIGVRLTGKHAIVGLGVLTPQLLNEIGGHIVACVVADHADHEDTVGLEVLVEKVLETVLAYFSGLVNELNALLYPRVRFARVGALKPLDELENVAGEHE